MSRQARANTCGHPDKPHSGHGMCNTCYLRHRRINPPTARTRPSMRGEHWRRDAACRGRDPEIWFPIKSNAESAEEGKRVCRGCPVRAECLRHALDFCEQYGIWGGLNERQLRALRKRMRDERGALR